MSAPRILIADCAPAASQAELLRFGGPTNQALFEAALRLHEPDVRCVTVNIADGEALLPGTGIDAFEGVILTGSPLHIYDPTLSVLGQIEFARAAFAAGVPVWGSCWGVQLATVALGGVVRRNPKGREVGIARRISLTASGRAHWLLQGRPPSFDGLCSHLDEVETLPAGGVVLAENSVSAVQAMAVTTPAGGTFLGTQYHPEHVFAFSAALIQMRAGLLAAEGLGRDENALCAFANDLRAPGEDGSRVDLAWRYGVDAEVLDPVRRTRELGQWLRVAVRRG